MHATHLCHFHPAGIAKSVQLKDYVLRVLELEGERDGMILKIQALQQQQQQQTEHGRESTALNRHTAECSSASGLTSEQQHQQELAQLRLQHEQSMAAEALIRQRLMELFSEDIGPEGGSGRCSSPGAAPAASGAATATAVALQGRGKNASCTGGRPGSLTREEELLATVTNLQAALERTMAGSTPLSRFNAEVAQRKAAQRTAARTRAELESMTQQLAPLATAKAQSAELQAANAALRAALAEARQAAADAQQTAQHAAQQAASTSSAGLIELKAALAERDAELGRLRAQATTMDANAGLQGTSPLAARVSELEQQNADLRGELGAFDPAFFEELEDMKHEHAELKRTCSAQATLIRRLQAALHVAGGREQS